jgi:hypothetical protein
MDRIKAFWNDHSGGLAADSAKAAVAIAFMSLVSAHWLAGASAPLEKDRLAQIASAASKGKNIDPMATGSIRKLADDTRLDPCVLPNKR